MMGIPIKLWQTAVLSVFVYLASCATVTVNVYFPAEEVRQAYSDLEQEFLGEDGSSSDTEKSPESQKSASEPQSLRNYPEVPLVRSKKVIVLKSDINLDLSEFAWAQGNISEQIANKIRQNPKAVKAYKRRAQRKNVINQMLSEGKVKEGSNGLLVKTGDMTSQQTQAFNAENSDRQEIIRYMAIAILEINNIETTPENINKVYNEAAKEFAKARN